MLVIARVGHDDPEEDLAFNVQPGQTAASNVSTPVRSHNHVVFATSALILMVAAYTLWQWQTVKEPRQPVPEELPSAETKIDSNSVRETTIMVMPFKDLSPTNENAYFAAGMYEDVLHKVSGIPGLRVIARNTANKFIENRKSPADISKELGITHLLTGSVRRDKKQVRINVRLISTDNEWQLWSESYDRRLDDIFTIQSDLATQIASAMQVNIDKGAAKQLAVKPTDNLVAYDLYIEGRELARQGTTFRFSGSRTARSRTVQIRSPVVPGQPSGMHRFVARNLGSCDGYRTHRAVVSSHPRCAVSRFVRRIGRVRSR